MSDSSSDNTYGESFSTTRKRFSPEEDAILKKLVQVEGIKDWEEISEQLPGRTSRQCRDRYNNYLFKEIVKRPWTPEEDRIIIEKNKIYGNSWSKIAQFLVGRSGNNVKNRWHKYLYNHYMDYNDLEEKKVPEPKEEPKKQENAAEAYCTYSLLNQKITFPDVLTCRPWELITPKDVYIVK
ncbi:Myb-like DNA-binding domain containing protein [Trichomonas vaginalis G3]|uniref:Myb-like DNA-binding domain containing protein n=1 Tax=Trichomonas vaginalis (strain ATCC PRA-98 / G3) TaxID=412133 RepID=A2EJ75_TRIV3|nr:RNA polymerase II transcription regulator recruiting protein [Trichomonas vaginalis G3]EAY07307.1 Myb-like DNA-binding domain containing protein [Trichomonas vaginalis G3]KAI5550484.1 RNA polymerase II transcription regulator recruiting protein [Trichomonas vaginalis G3]|eukprot:XP_001319530.1 Myb-like DNA-binding domain containing protein [Trichomonas vaginalis G3]